MKTKNSNKKFNIVNGYGQLFILIFCLSFIGSGSPHPVFAQKQTKPKIRQKRTVAVAEKNKEKSSSKQDDVKDNLAESEPDRNSDGRLIFADSGERPPLMTTVVGQVTTVKLYESPLQFKVDRAGLNISESNELSDNNYLYIIPTEPGIRRNMVIEFKTGKVEFEIESIEVKKGSTAKFTREVEIRASQKSDEDKSLNKTITNLRRELKESNEELRTFPDRMATAVDQATQRELLAQADFIIKRTKKDKGKSVTDKEDKWRITEVFSEHQASINRRLRVFEIKYKGDQESGKILEIKSSNDKNIFYLPESMLTGKTQEKGFTVDRRNEIKVVVIEYENNDNEKRNISKSFEKLLFISSDGIVEF